MFKKQKFHHVEDKKPEDKWWSFKLEEVWEKVDSNEKGLTLRQVKKRRKKHGKNELPKKEKEGMFDILIAQVKSSLVVVLLVAALISLALSDVIDAGIILLAVVINIVVGFWQEMKTSRALEALQKIIVAKAKVLRNGEEKLINTSSLVPGDIILLSAGDKVPADARLFKIHDLKINEAILTGESEPCDKISKPLEDDTVLAERNNMAFMGTLVSQGNAHGIVIATGQKTAIGQIAQLVAGVKEDKTPLQKKLDRFAMFLTKVVLTAAILIFILGIIFGHSFREMFVTAIAVAVAAVPEGLAVTVTVVLAVGMQRILKHNALVRKLLGAEILGSTNVICVDKTGTLTEGKMQVVKVVTEDTDIDLKSSPTEGESAEQGLFLLQIGMMCNNAYIAAKEEKLTIDHLVGNLTEKTLLLAGTHVGLDKKTLEKQYPRLDEIPFDSHYKFMMTLNKHDSENNMIYLKGAPEKVLLFSNFVYSQHSKSPLELNSYKREKFIKLYEDMSKQGLRVLALGYKKVPAGVDLISDNTKSDATQSRVKQAMAELYTNFVLVGLVGIKDPIRKNVKETVELTKDAGMNTVMITGDNKFTARVIAREAGLDVEDENIIEGEEVEKMSESDLKEKVTDIKVYARTTPEEKLKIVKAWQNQGAVVAMTGDGINDAPALKQADIGVALGTATDVAKEASDLILLSNNFKTIVEAVRQGRIIFVNITKIILYYLSDSMAEVLIIIIALLLKWPLPILASQIIWVNLIDDTFPALALTQDPSTYNVMKDKPVKREASVLNLESNVMLGLISSASALFALFAFLLIWQGNGANLDLARTFVFTVIASSSLFYVFSIRNLKKPIWQTKIFSNKFLIASIVFGFFLQSIAIYHPFLQKIFQTVPLGFWHWVYIILIDLLIVGIIEIVKWRFYRKNRKF